jgi:hypothetical protein
VGQKGDILSNKEHPYTTINQRLQQPTFFIPATKRGQLQAIIDYSKSICLTNPEHFAHLKVLRNKQQKTKDWNTTDKRKNMQQQNKQRKICIGEGSKQESTKLLEIM